MKFDDLASAIIAGIVVGILLIVFAIATGQTFGQRCSVQFEKGSKGWNECVKRLSDGGTVDGPSPH